MKQLLKDSLWPEEGHPRDMWVAQNMFSIHQKTRMRHALQLMALHSIKVHFKRKRRQAAQHIRPPGAAAEGGGSEHALVGPEAAGAALLECCRSGNIRQVERLVAQGVDVNWQSGQSKETALAAACTSGHYECVLLLLANQADSYLHDKDDASPLMRAAQGGQADIIQLLLGKGGADAYHTSSVTGRSALLEAAAVGSCPCITVLVKRGGADVNIANAQDGNHPLLAAALQGHLRAVKLLLSLGAKINRADTSGNVAILAAARNGDTPMVRCLLDKGAKTCIADFIHKHTPLMVAASRGAQDTVEVLLQAQDAASSLAVLDAQGRSAVQVCGRPKLRALLQSHMDRTK